MAPMRGDWTGAQLKALEESGTAGTVTTTPRNFRPTGGRDYTRIQRDRLDAERQALEPRERAYYGLTGHRVGGGTIKVYEDHPAYEALVTGAIAGADMLAYYR